jgi:alanine dehydrogenase
MTLLLSEADVARCLDYPPLMELMQDTLGRFSRGEAVQPVRSNMAIRPAGGFYGVMPAHLPGPDGGVFGLKSVSFFPGNEAKGLHTHLATILLLDGATGALRAILDGRLITEMRTAAVSAVAVRLLARSDARRLAILGAGVQGKAHALAIAATRSLAEISIWSRSYARAAGLRAELEVQLRLPVRSVQSARDALHHADIIVTATSATEPILEAGWIAPGAHLCVVGSSHPRRREVDTATITASRVFVDSRDAAAVEAGDLLIPVLEGAFELGRVAGELGDVVNGVARRETREEVTLFKSLGIGVEDIATAAMVVGRARELGLGEEREV